MATATARGNLFRGAEGVSWQGSGAQGKGRVGESSPGALQHRNLASSSLEFSLC